MNNATAHTPPPARLDLTDPERRNMVFDARDRKGRLRSIAVAPPWYWRRWRVERFLRTLSYQRLALLINHLIALAQGVPVDVLEEMAAGAGKLSAAEREQRINELIVVIAAEMKMPPKEVAELPARDLAMLAEQVNVKLQRENQWRELIAGLRR